MKIAFTPGEPAGIGLDLAIINAQKSNKNIQLTTFTDPDLLLNRAKILNLPINIKEYGSCKNKGDILIHPIKCHNKVSAGLLDVNSSQFVLNTLNEAINSCKNNNTQAMLTGPVHKGIINKSGVKFSGHTEYLADKTSSKSTMMLANSKLKVALVTTHIALSDVAKQITKDRLKTTIKTLHSSLIKQFGIAKPRITICGLNPHAGEDGYLGLEEINIINPVICEFKAQGMNLIGAVPADTAFTKDKLATTDAYLAMYHDQGLVALKTLDFKKSVNITLGLPFIRVSVDHGTALDLAGTGNISLGSFNTALKYLKKYQSKTPI